MKVEFKLAVTMEYPDDLARPELVALGVEGHSAKTADNFIKLLDETVIREMVRLEPRIIMTVERTP